MENLKRLKQTLWAGIRTALAAFFLAATTVYLPAQKGFEDRFDFQEIQEILTMGIDSQDVYLQALGWYKWGLYRENQTENRDSAFQYLARSVDLFLKAKDTVAYHRARAELAARLPERGEADDALRMQEEARDYFRKIKNRRLEILVLAQMSRVYQIKGDTAKANALRNEFRQKGMMLKDTALLITVFMEDIGYLRREKNYGAALPLAFRVLQLAQESNRPEYVIWAESNIGFMSEESKDYRMALNFLHRAEQSLPNMVDPRRRDIYRHLFSTYAAIKSDSIALEYARRYMELGDILLSRDRLVTSQRLAVQYGEKERTQKMQDLRQMLKTIEQAKQAQLYFLYILLLFFAAIILALFFIVRDYRHRLYTNRVIAGQNEKINRQTIQQLEDALRIESMQGMLEGQESERRRIATDLHDSLGGLLAAAKIRLENLTGKLPELDKNKEFVKIKRLLDDTIAETRQIARNLQPGTLHQFGLIKAIQDLTGRVHGDGTPTIDFQHIGSFDDIDHTVSLNCYRIVQELLQNSLKHAEATEILVQLTCTDNELALLVEDNGTGYDPKTVTKGMGTDNLKQRVQFIKGEISIQSGNGQGTSTMVTVPLN